MMRIPLARVDQGLAALRYIKSHPAWIVGSAVLLMVLRIGRVWKRLQSARATWQRMHKPRDG